MRIRNARFRFRWSRLFRKPLHGVFRLASKKIILDMRPGRKCFRKAPEQLQPETIVQYFFRRPAMKPPPEPYLNNAVNAPLSPLNSSVRTFQSIVASGCCTHSVQYLFASSSALRVSPFHRHCRSSSVSRLNEAGSASDECFRVRHPSGLLAQGGCLDLPAFIRNAGAFEPDKRRIALMKLQIRLIQEPGGARLYPGAVAAVINDCRGKDGHGILPRLNRSRAISRSRWTSMAELPGTALSTFISASSMPCLAKKSAHQS